MPDIAMCTGADCGDRSNCYRFTAKPSKLQSMFIGTPRAESGDCEHMLPNDNIKPLRAFTESA
jgi:hypothetical protein